MPHTLWRVRIDAPGAISIDLALARFRLPAVPRRG